MQRVHERDLSAELPSHCGATLGTTRPSRHPLLSVSVRPDPSLLTGAKGTHVRAVTWPRTLTVTCAQMHAQPQACTQCTHRLTRTCGFPQGNGSVSGLEDRRGQLLSNQIIAHVTPSPENSFPFPQPDNYKVQNSKPNEYTIL